MIEALIIVIYSIAGTLGLAILMTAIFLQPRRRRYIDERLAEVEHNIGDGAWLATPANYPRSSRIRDIEPRGA